MKKEIVALPGIKESKYSFSHVVKAGEVLYLTSQLSCNLKTGEILRGNIEQQTRNALENVKYLLENSHSSLKHVLRVVVYMRDVAEFAGMNHVYEQYFNDEAPARVTIQSPSPIPGIDVEIEVTALTNE